MDPRAAPLGSAVGEKIPRFGHPPVCKCSPAPRLSSLRAQAAAPKVTCALSLTALRPRHFAIMLEPRPRRVHVAEHGPDAALRLWTTRRWFRGNARGAPSDLPSAHSSPIDGPLEATLAELLQGPSMRPHSRQRRGRTILGPRGHTILWRGGHTVTGRRPHSRQRRGRTIVGPRPYHRWQGGRTVTGRRPHSRQHGGRTVART
jgi:hypothetical protein